MQAASHTTDRVSLAIAMMLVAYFLFATLDTSIKWLLGLGFSALQLAFLRYAGHFVVSLGEAALKGGAQAVRVPQGYFGLVVLRGSLLASATVGNFIVLKFLPLTTTSAIMFSAPIIVCLLAGPMLSERVGPWRLLAILIGFGGVLVVMQPFGEEFHWAAVLAVFNALGMALYSILTRKLAGHVRAGTMQFYTGAVGTFALAPFAWFSWVPSTDIFVWSLWAGLGVFGWAGHELLTRAHAYAPASTLMPFSYSFLIYLIGYSYVIFAHIPSASTLAGASIIVLSGLIIWKREQVVAARKGAQI